MFKLYLVRHAEYDNLENIYPFHLPLNLSHTGRDHAKRIGEWFKKNNIFIPIFSSPIVRAVQTSEIIASKTTSFVSIDQRLVETKHLSLQGKKILKKDDWENQREFPERETTENQRDRVLAIIHEKIDQNISSILVSHGDPLTITFMSLLEKTVSPENITDKEYIKKGEIIELNFEKKKLLSYERFRV